MSFKNIEAFYTNIENFNRFKSLPRKEYSMLIFSDKALLSLFNHRQFLRIIIKPLEFSVPTQISPRMRLILWGYPTGRRRAHIFPQPADHVTECVNLTSVCS